VRFQVDDPGTLDTTIVHYIGSYYGREKHRGRDVDVCFGGAIAITEIPLDITGDGKARE
jgi:hypothetical protein